MKNIIWPFLVFLSTTVCAQKTNKTITTVEIQTSAVCDMCKDLIIQKNLAYEKGVKYAEMDLNTGILTLNYRKDKTSLDHLRNVISKLGYSADSVKADSLAYEKLHFCCKNPDIKLKKSSERSIK